MEVTESVLQQIRRASERYAEIEGLISDAAVAADPVKYRDLMKEYTALSPLIGTYTEYRRAEKEAAEAQTLASEATDAEERSLAEEEMLLQQKKKEELAGKLLVLLLPKDPDDDKDVIVEIRGCAGGEEAALFAADLYRMYCMFADANGYKIELLSANETELGGYKEIDFQFSGTGAFARMKYESGVHRVQRVPRTEQQGRIQTSTATVAVLPVVDEVTVAIDPADITMETCKSSGAGGQHINKTESAVRLIHKPTGIVVECQEERSQYKNRDKAMKMLCAKLYEIKSREQHDMIASSRKTQVGTGDRSEKIRTYNYPQGRVTDHRIGLTLYTLDRFMNGNITEMLDTLAREEAANKLRQTPEEE